MHFGCEFFASYPACIQSFGLIRLFSFTDSGESKATEDREYSSLEKIRDNYPKYVMTTDYILQNRNGIIHVNLMEFIKENKMF